MKFFENQKIDEIGFVSVRLQKALIFLMVITSISLIQSIFWHGAGVIGSALYLAFLALVFRGAVKRKERAIRCYYIAHIVFAVIIIIGAILFAVSYSHHRREDRDGQMQDVIPVDSNSTEPIPLVAPDEAYERDGDDGDTQEGDAGTGAGGDSDNDTPTSSDDDDDDQSGRHHWKKGRHHWKRGNHKGGRVALMVVFMVLQAVVFAVKIFSLVVAFRLSKMLRAEQAVNLAHPIATRQQPQQSQYPYAYTPVMYIPMSVNSDSSQPQQQPAQPQPGMYPYFGQPVAYNPYIMPQVQPQAPQHPQV